MMMFLLFAASAIVSLATAAAVRRVAIRLGAVVPPRPDRWHRQATPTFGGLAVAAPFWISELRLVLPVMAAGLALFGIGWYDDVRPFSASAKIVNSLAAA